MVVETKQFCRECNNMLYPKEDKLEKMLYLACRNCEHFEEAITPTVYTVEYRKSKGRDVITSSIGKEIAEDPTLRRVEKECTRCSCKVHAVFQKKDERGDEPLSVNYACCRCFKITNSLDGVNE
ncbi:DNA-directed RNA polymerase II subunit RPB9 [Nematocida sp. ERTm5]|nr:DNA-directed RNA polymerase II subunit RPB9 [Nematocida sp. AWRm79]KAI5168234.1 DNA-directed RNA polymerase II subunit RPB9 [Nematocida sp. AWRm79]KAI5185854.1 DNA-directed RNA polymerase II subunit RPB9 [Nematocida sp. AWRm78]KAI5187323.1 DNA-directed RNA polymerase II subunit RPB9 [Nematocida sp. AWRm78]OAG32348.1 DNA-directed RNA polymerase II subunit RPB9 [Nematocida sp. ERTm5]